MFTAFWATGEDAAAATGAAADAGLACATAGVRTMPGPARRAKAPRRNRRVDGGEKDMLKVRAMARGFSCSPRPPTELADGFGRGTRPAALVHNWTRARFTPGLRWVPGPGGRVVRRHPVRRRPMEVSPRSGDVRPHSDGNDGR